MTPADCSPTPQAPGQVHLIEDDEGLRLAVSSVLAFAGYPVRDWVDAEAFLDALPLDGPSVVVTDMRLPGASGIDLHASLLERGYRTPVIYISGESSVPETVSAMKMGAVEFLLKPFSREALLQAVASGLRRDCARFRQEAEMARLKPMLLRLTRREQEVFRLLRRGFSNNEIMAQMHLSLPTAKQYKASVMRKLGVHTLSQLIQASACLPAEDD